MSKKSDFKILKGTIEQQTICYNEKNTLSSILNIFAWTILILGCLGSLVISFDFDYGVSKANGISVEKYYDFYFNWRLFLPCIFSAVLFSLILFSLKNILFYLHRMAYTTNLYILKDIEGTISGNEVFITEPITVKGLDDLTTSVLLALQEKPQQSQPSLPTTKCPSCGQIVEIKDGKCSNCNFDIKEYLQRKLSKG